MFQKSLIIFTAILLATVNTVMAETSIQQIQSPIYTDNIGRAHFLGKGGYSAVRQTQMNQAQADFVNDAVNNLSNKKDLSDSNTYSNKTEKDITSVINERTDIPVSSKTKASFSSSTRQPDPSAAFGNGATYLPTSGVNDSKTIYTDDLGRLHFFGKGNMIKE